MAGPASPLPHPLHPDLGILVERGRGLLRQADEAPTKTRRLPTRIVELQAAINRFLAETNAEPQSPSAGPPIPIRIIAAVERGHQALHSIH